MTNYNFAFICEANMDRNSLSQQAAQLQRSILKREQRRVADKAQRHVRRQCNNICHLSWAGVMFATGNLSWVVCRTVHDTQEAAEAAGEYNSSYDGGYCAIVCDPQCSCSKACALSPKQPRSEASSTSPVPALHPALTFLNEHR